LLSSIKDSCVTDMCLVLNKTRLRCDHYDEFDKKCASYGQPTEPTWRVATNCGVTCGANQEYFYKTTCPKRCADMTGTQCLQFIPQWGCWCKDGYFADATGNCVTDAQCGCFMPDGSYLPLNSTEISADCGKIYSCNSSGATATVEYRTPCDVNAICQNTNGQPNCTCKAGYTGNGTSCRLSEGSCQADFCYGLGDPHYRTPVRFGSLEIT
jgi:hypothetical protein